MLWRLDGQRLNICNSAWLLYISQADEPQNAATGTKPSALAATMQTIRQYDVFSLSKDLNPRITKGMHGVILEVLEENAFLIEFVQEDGSNYEYEGEATFTIDKSFISEIIWTNSK